MIINFFFLFFILITIQLTNETNDYTVSSYNYYDGKTGLMAKIKYTKEKFKFKDYSISPKNNKTSAKLIRNLILNIKLECDGIIHFEIYDEENNRFRPNLTDESYINKINNCKQNLNLDDNVYQL